MKFFLVSPTLLMMAIVAFSSTAFANIAYSPWVHEITQKGADLEVTVTVFDETSATNDEGEPLPGLDSAYTLERWSFEEEPFRLFEDRVFDPNQAEQVTAHTCQPWNGEPHQSDCTLQESCVDCDNDGLNECFGFCGVAYRYKVIDTCPPPGAQIYYSMFTSSSYDLWADGEGLSFTSTGAEDIGAACQDSSSADCSVRQIAMGDRGHGFLLIVLKTVMRIVL